MYLDNGCHSCESPIQYHHIIDWCVGGHGICIEGRRVTPTRVCSSADLGGSSDYSSEMLEGRRGEGFRVQVTLSQVSRSLGAQTIFVWKDLVGQDKTLGSFLSNGCYVPQLRGSILPRHVRQCSVTGHWRQYTYKHPWRRDLSPDLESFLFFFTVI